MMRARRRSRGRSALKRGVTDRRSRPEVLRRGVRAHPATGGQATRPCRRSCPISQCIGRCADGQWFVPTGRPRYRRGSGSGEALHRPGRGFASARSARAGSKSSGRCAHLPGPGHVRADTHASATRRASRRGARGSQPSGQDQRRHGSRGVEQRRTSQSHDRDRPLARRQRFDPGVHRSVGCGLGDLGNDALHFVCRGSCGPQFPPVGCRGHGRRRWGRAHHLVGHVEVLSASNGTAPRRDCVISERLTLSPSMPL